MHLHGGTALTFKRRIAASTSDKPMGQPVAHQAAGRDPVHKLHTPRWVFASLKFITDRAPKPPIP
jgi:hypothetical protein